MRTPLPLPRSCQLYVALLALLLVAACSHSSDEQQIREVIDAAESAAEARNTSDVLDLVAQDYADAQGFDKAQLQNFLRAYFLTHPKIELVVRIGHVELETANRARVRVEIVMLGTQLGAQHETGTAATALAGEAETLQVELNREESEWRVSRVDRVAT